MTLARRSFLRLTAGALALPFAGRTARAQSDPARPVRILVGFPAGGPVDIAARVIAPWLSERMGQPFIVENMPGASGNLATAAAVKAEPDGHTLLLCGPVNTINTTLFPGLGFDFARDIAPIAAISRVPLVVEVHPSVAARSVPEFLALARAAPKAMTVAYAGNGTPQHVGIALFGMMAGLDFAMKPYLGSAPALADLLVGKVQAMFDPMPSSIGPIRRGALIPLAVTSPKRSDALPDIPAMTEFVPGYEAGSWFGLGAPTGVPATIARRLNEEVNAALADRQIQARLAEMGASPMLGSPADFGAFIAAETMTFAKVIKAAGITAG